MNINEFADKYGVHALPFRPGDLVFDPEQMETRILDATINIFETVKIPYNSDDCKIACRKMFIRARDLASDALQDLRDVE